MGVAFDPFRGLARPLRRGAQTRQPVCARALHQPEDPAEQEEGRRPHKQPGLPSIGPDAAGEGGQARQGAGAVEEFAHQVLVDGCGVPAKAESQQASFEPSAVAAHIVVDAVVGGFEQEGFIEARAARF